MENGPLKMYKIPQIVQHDFPVELPTCMYPMKNIHGDERRNGNVIKTAHHVFNENRNLDISDQVKLFLKVFHTFICTLLISLLLTIYINC